MAKGFAVHLNRTLVLTGFGKDLARRAKSHCELCGASGVGLMTYEVPPVPPDPEFDRSLLICEECHRQLERPRLIEADHWRPITGTMWSQVPVVQVMALRMLRRLSTTEDWAREALEELYSEPEIEAWAAEADIE